MTPAKKFNPEMQATNRVLRVDQVYEVEIMRIILRNTHDVFREARQTSHMRLEIATQAHRADVRQELVTVLNEYQKTIAEWQAWMYERRDPGNQDDGASIEDSKLSPGQVQHVHGSHIKENLKPPKQERAGTWDYDEDESKYI